MDIREDILRKQERMIIYLFLAYSFILLLFCSKLSPFYTFSEWPDINIYFNIGKAIANGEVLYKDVFDHKGPLIFFIYSLGYLISNTSFVGVYIIESLFLFAGLLAVFKLTRLYVSRLLSVIVALFFSLFWLLYSGYGGTAEEFIAILQVISLCLFFRYYKVQGQHKPLWMVVHGAMLMLVFFIKLNLVVFWFFPLVALFISFFYKREYHLALRNLIALFLGMFLASLPFLLYFAFTGSFADFWYAYFQFNALYSASEVTSDFIMGLIVSFPRFIITNYFFMGVILLGLGAILFTRFFASSWLMRLAIVLSFFFMFTVIFMTGWVFEYYLIPMAIFTIPACILVASFTQKFMKLPESNLICACFCVLFVLFGSWMKGNLNKGRTAEVSEVFSKEIDKTKSVDRSLLCLGLGYDLGTFTRANIVPTVKYFFSPNILYEKYPVIVDAQQTYVQNREVEFVMVRDNYKNFHQLAPALESNYKIINSFSDGKTVYYLYQRKP